MAVMQMLNVVDRLERAPPHLPPDTVRKNVVNVRAVRSWKRRKTAMMMKSTTICCTLVVHFELYAYALHGVVLSVHLLLAI